MIVKKVIFLLSVFLIVALNFSTPVVFKEAIGENRSESMKKDSDTISNSNTLLIRSFPPGLETYITPLNEFSSSQWKWTSKEYLIGRTPVEVQLNEGQYRVVVTKFDEPVAYYEDGEFTKIGQREPSGFILGGKVYKVVKRQGHNAMLISLYWPKELTIADFVKKLPNHDFITFNDRERASYENLFQKYKIPQKDWEYLITMFRRTGKLVWHGENESDYMYTYIIEKKNNSKFIIATEPVLDLE